MFIPTASHKNGQQYSDQEIIRRYVEEKSEIWVNELYRRYIHLIYGACLKFTADRNVSKEVSLLVFEKMLSLLPRQSVEEVRNFNVWLFVLIKNTCISHMRKEKAEFNRKQKIQQDNYKEVQFFENEGLQKLLNTEMITGQPEKLKILINEALKELSIKQRKCIQLFFYDKLSYKEIARETRMDVSEIKSALQNGKRKLRLFLRNKLNPA